MEKEALEYLIKKYLEGTASINEIIQLNKWYDSFDSRREDLYVHDTQEVRQAVAKKFSELRLRLAIGETVITV